MDVTLPTPWPASRVFQRGLRNRSGSATGPSLLPGAGAPGGTTQSPFDGGFSWAKAASWLPGIPKKKSVDYTRAAKRLGELPVIVVANKSDLLSPSFRRPNTLADYGIESVEMVCRPLPHPSAAVCCRVCLTIRCPLVVRCAVLCCVAVLCCAVLHDVCGGHRTRW